MLWSRMPPRPRGRPQEHAIPQQPPAAPPNPCCNLSPCLHRIAPTACTGRGDRIRSPFPGKDKDSRSSGGRASGSRFSPVSRATIFVILCNFNSSTLKALKSPQHNGFADLTSLFPVPRYLSSILCHVICHQIPKPLWEKHYGRDRDVDHRLPITSLIHTPDR
jgi:hypothetical protein